MAAKKKKTVGELITYGTKPRKLTRSATKAIKSTHQSEDQTDKTSEHQADAGHGSRLLSLPPEIRNSIYELVLYHDAPIHVDSDLKLLPLLATCSGFHIEASSIWYRDNHFRAVGINCDATALHKWTQNCCTVGQRDYFDVSIELRDRINWDRLVDWCYAVWKDDKARMLVDEPGKSSIIHESN